MAEARRAISMLVMTELSEPSQYPHLDNDFVFRMMADISVNRASVLGTARIENYVSDTVPRYSDPLFRAHFRMTRSSFRELLEMIGPYCEVRTISLEQRTLACLWYIANQETFRGVVDRFGMSKGSLHYYLENFCNIITGSSILPTLLKWPAESSLAQIATGFAERAGFPGVVGAIDGTHIEIPAPGQHRDSYICRKGFPALHAQLVCDSTLQFTDVYCGYPGSVHDARVYKNSPLMSILNDLPSKYHLIGDAAYPNSSVLLSPYRDNGHLLPEQKNYNYKHSSTRVDIERAIGLLKGKFRKMKYLDMRDVKKMPKVVVTCCVLHNFIIRHESYHNEEIENMEFESSSKASEHAEENSDCQSGVNKRLMVTAELC